MEAFNSLNEAIKSLSQPNYGPNAVTEDNLIKIEFKINQIVDDKLDAATFSHYFGNDESVLLTFQSTVGDRVNKIFWRVTGTNSFHILDIFDDLDGTVTRICQIFLIDKLRKGENGILKSSAGKKIYGVQDLGNIDGHNLLIKAVTDNNAVLVSKLLKYHFDLDFEFEYSENKKLNAIDKAWEAYVHSTDKVTKSICSQIMLNLLKANSKFPYEFNYDIACDDIKDFIDECEELRDFVDDGDVTSLTEKIQSSPNISYFYDDNNESLMFYALKNKKHKIYNLLASLDLNIGCHEIYGLQEVYATFEARQRRVLRTRNQATAKQFPKAHLLILKSKSKIGNNDRDSRKHWRCINEAYETIDQNEGASKVLQVVATCKSLRIFFDFTHDSTYYFDPYSSAGSRGITYTSGVINIGARSLLKEDNKYEVYGVLAHEFCHLALLMSYMNNFNPYPMGDNEDTVRFVDVVATECEKNQDFEKLVKNVYDLYPKDEHHSELIVLVPQMTMNYHIKDPNAECENSKIIADRMKKFPELFKYFKEVVEPQLEKAVPVLVNLQDDNQDVRYADLTQPMKAKLFHSKVKFQGISISLFDIIGDDDEILKLLPSDDIKDILLDREFYEFGDVCRMSAKYGYIERNFMKSRNGTDAFTFGHVKNIVENSKIFILTGKAGCGKTTTFENLSKKLKVGNENYWISFIRLRNFREIFDEFSSSNVDPNLEEVITLLCKVIFPRARKKNFNFDADFGIRVFKKLFVNNQVILLFDGIDEICPKFNVFIAAILKLLKEKSKIQLWISTRPQHAEQFEDKFSTESYIHEPYSRVNQRMMINEIFRKSDVATERRSFELLYTNIGRMFKKYDDFNNPLIIVIITELYISGKIDFEIDSINLYEIYEKLIDAQVEKVESKIDSKERSIFLNFKLLFQVLALRFIFDDTNLTSLSIIRRWKKEKKNWTAEKIQRFGFVIVDLSFLETDDRNSIDFVHKTFAEFFVVQFIVEVVFNDDEDIRKEEIETICQLVELLESGKNGSFLLSFFNKKSNIKEKCLQPNIKELISKQIEKSINSEQFDTKILVFWCQFLQNDPATLKKLWKGTGDKSLFRNIYFYRKEAEFYAISSLISFLCDCLGEDWYEVLMKKDIKYAAKVINFGKFEKRMYDKHIFKLLHFMDENFTKDEHKLFWRDFFFYFQALDREDIPEEALSMLFDEFYKLYPDEEGIHLHIIKRLLCEEFGTVHITSFMRCLEQTFNKDFNKIQKVLFSKTVSKAFMTNLTDEDNNDFTFISSLYIKYKASWEDVQNVFIEYGNFFEIFKVMRESLLIFVQQMRFIFESNKDKLIQFINNSTIPFNAEVFIELEGFLVEMFSKDESFIIQGIRSILYRDDKFSDYFSNLGSKSIENIQEIIAIYRKYQASPEELKNYFKSWPILTEMFYKMELDDYSEFKEFIDDIFASNKKEIINCIQYSTWNLKIFFLNKNYDFIKKFTADYFDGNEDDINEFIKTVIKYSMEDTKYHKNNYYEHFLLKFYSENVGALENLKNILTKYLTKPELKTEFLSQNIYTKSFG
ncbi:uncharacterized protein [Chironomus tepperi]